MMFATNATAILKTLQRGQLGQPGTNRPTKVDGSKVCLLDQQSKNMNQHNFQALPAHGKSSEIAFKKIKELFSQTPLVFEGFLVAFCSLI